MNVAVFFGGKSVERDISVITALQAMSRLDKNKYDVFPVYMRDGVVYTGALDEVGAYSPFMPKKHQKVWLIGGIFYTRVKGILIKRYKPDVALICCHGGEGESGALQGMLEMNGLPYTGCRVLQSAIGMDKAAQKELFSGLMLNVVENVVIDRADYDERPDEILLHIDTLFDYPLMVKPATLGSSIGISRAANRAELIEAVDVAKEFDTKIVIERALTNFTELNCAAVSDGTQIVVSEVGRPMSWQSYLTFEDKYIGGGKGMESAKRELPANIDADTYLKVKAVTLRLFKELGLDGVVRVDYLLDNDAGKLFINEINTIPGSLAYYLFEPLGLSYTALLDMLIDGAVKKHEAAASVKNEYISDVLKNLTSLGSKKR